MEKSRKVLALVSTTLALSGVMTGCNSGDNSSAGTSANSSGLQTSPSSSSVACSNALTSKIVGRYEGTHLSTPKASSSENAVAFKKLHGHMLSPKVRASDLGKVEDTQDVPITIALQLNHQDQLEKDIAEMYRPGSPQYHQFVKPEEFRAKYGPTQSQIDQVNQYLQQKGLRSIHVDANGLLVHAVGKASDVSSAFQTELHHYQDANGRTFFANSYEIQIPEGLAIQGVHGLHNYAVAHNHLKAAKSQTNHGGSGPGGAYSPSDIRTAYQIPSSLDGSGQTLAVFELDGYNSSNIQAYQQQFGLPNVPLQNVLVDGASGSAAGGEDEVELDIELMMAVAPKASKIVVYEGPNSDQGTLDTYSKIASDNIAQSISTSWGNSEDSVTSSFMQSENTVFEQMAAQGQTIYSAAGDTGADDNGSSLSVDDPSAQPYVVAVGGTSLSTGSGGAYASESTWNDGSGAGGGGISTVWSVPSWQQGLSVTQNKGSTTMRMIPDVSLNSDINEGYAIYAGGTWGTWGGTSAAAPIWAAFNALVNQQRAANGLGPVGYVTPTIYSIGKGSSYANDFNDIADNSTNGYYPAVSGYDLATGWGSFKATSLLKDLAGNAPVTSTSSSMSTCSAQ